MDLELFVPGRLCVIGEHSDWAGGHRRFNSDIVKGYALVSGIAQGCYARVKAHPSKLCLSSTLNDGSVLDAQFPMQAEELLKVAQEGKFFSYACGVAYEIVTNYEVGGLIVDNYKTDIPIKKGLSSSAAICVLIARAFNRIYNLKLSINGVMDLAYRGEILTPSRCGRLDQCCAYGQKVVLVTFDGDRIITKPLRLNTKLYLVLVDLGASKDTPKILSDLNKAFPFAENSIERGVQHMLGPINRDLVNECVSILERADDIDTVAEDLGKVMSTFQRKFDELCKPACPEQLTAPELHRVLVHQTLTPHITGGKGVGSQGDGTAQFLCRSEQAQDEVVKIIEDELKLSCLKLTLGGDGKRECRKAVIPVAGYGISMFPASKVVKTPMFPIVDRKGIVKPAILHLVEEVLESGIEEVVIVCQEHDKQEFRALFQDHLPIENYNLLPPHLKRYHGRVLNLGKHVRFVTQPQQIGFGNAVLCARDAVGDEPFLLLLGDHIYSSTIPDVSCTSQVLKAFETHQCNIISIEPVAESEISRVGLVTGRWMKYSQQPGISSSLSDQYLFVTDLSEKPSVSAARQFMKEHSLSTKEQKDADVASSPFRPTTLSLPASASSISSSFALEVKPNNSQQACNNTQPQNRENKISDERNNKKDYIGIFGMYVLTPQIFDLLQDFEDKNLRDTSRGQFELTPALSQLRRVNAEGIVGIPIKGSRHDIGNPTNYLSAASALYQKTEDFPRISNMP